MTYDKEINRLRRKIESIDREILIKISELSEIIKHLKLKSEFDYGHQFINWGKLEILVKEKNLDSKRTSEVFKKIRHLIEGQWVK